MVRPLLGYIRVSTSRQGRSGLGIEAQRRALERFAASEGFDLVLRGTIRLSWTDKLGTPSSIKSLIVNSIATLSTHMRYAQPKPRAASVSHFDMAG